MKTHGAVRSLLATTLIVALSAPLMARPAVVGAPPAKQAATRASAPISIGPYIQNVSDVSATICWATLAGQVRLQSTSASARLLPVYDHHRITVHNLQPGTTYTYGVLREGIDSGKIAFTTAPRGEHPFTFDVLSDTHARSNNRNHGAFVHRILADHPAMVFNTGDITDDGLEVSDWQSFFEISMPLMRSISYYAAIGNHDRQSEYFYDFFSVPGNPHYYSFNRGAAHFVVLDVIGPYISETDPVPSQGDTQRFYAAGKAHWDSMLAWLRQDLQDYRTAKYIFVFFHYPIYTANRSKDLPRDVRTHFGSIFADNKVTAVFNGHNHNYHRAVAGGVTFIVSGVKGPGSISNPEPESVKYARGPTYLRVDIGPEKALVRAVGIDGTLVDEFALAARATPQVVPAGVR